MQTRLRRRRYDNSFVSAPKDDRRVGTSISMALLRHILIERQELVTGAHRDALARVVSSLLASYPQAVGLNAFYLLHVLSPERAQTFLLHDVQLLTLNETGASTFLANLALFPSGEVSEKFLQLSRTSGRIGDLAEM